MVVCLEQGADLHMVQLMPLPLTVSCFSKIQIGFTFLVPAQPGSPGRRAVKRVCVCVCTEIILHCVSVRNQLQQWTNLCTNFSPKKWGRRRPRPTKPLGSKLCCGYCLCSIVKEKYQRLFVQGQLKCQYCPTSLFRCSQNLTQHNALHSAQ